MVDLCVMRADRLDPFLDPDRHGRPLVWFDRSDRLAAVPDLRVADRAAAHRRALIARIALFGHIPGKALARGHHVEAVDAYHKMLLRPLVDLLRHAHAPKRFDFGLRYLDVDLPPDLARRLETLVWIGDETALHRAIAAARAWIDEILADPASSPPTPRPATR